MRSKINTSYLFVIKAVFLLLVSMPSWAISLALTPASQTANVGDTVQGNLVISGVGDGISPSLSTYDPNVGFNPLILSYSGAVFGDPVLGNQLDLSGLGSLNAATGGQGTVTSQQTIGTATTPELASRYRKYREILSTKSPDYQAELFNWAGSFHKAMVILGQRLGSGEHTLQEVISLMGEPDEVLQNDFHPYGTEIPSGEKHAVYFWRGRHDYLYFVVRREIVVMSRWWHAYE